MYAPPALEHVEDIEKWQTGIENWQYVTDLKEKKQGPVAFLLLRKKII